jgi:hypothetical protein
MMFVSYDPTAFNTTIRREWILDALWARAIELASRPNRPRYDHHTDIESCLRTRDLLQRHWARTDSAIVVPRRGGE